MSVIRNIKVFIADDSIVLRERLLEMLPEKFGRKLARQLPLRVILGAKVVARK